MHSNMRSEEPIIVAQSALAAFLKQSADTIACTPLTGGFDEGTIVKCVHENTKYVVKLFNNHASGKREIVWTQQASGLGIGPKFYYADPDGNYIIMEFVEGTPLVPDVANTPIILKNVAISIARLHNSSVPFAQTSDVFTRIEEKYKKLATSGELKELLENTGKYVKKIEKQIEGITIPLVPCQNDLNPRNIFVNNNQVTIIDWGDAALGNPYYDIAVFFVLNSIETKNEKFFLEQYDPKLLEPQWQTHLQTFKYLVNFEFALNLLSGVQALDSKMLHTPHISQVNNLSYYLILFAQQEVETDSAFLYSMAIASLNEIKITTMNYRCSASLWPCDCSNNTK